MPRAHDAITAELAATTRRLRAIEQRWIPEHEAALRKLELTLEERELEDTARVRWALERQQLAAPGTAFVELRAEGPERPLNP